MSVLSDYDLAQVADGLAAGLHRRHREGDTIQSLAALTGMPVGIVAGLVALGRRRAVAGPSPAGG